MLNEPATKNAASKSVTHNQIGQKIGSKGLRTRLKLIDVTVSLLDTHGLRDLTVADIARAATTSPATFYVYFDGVPEVVLAALETVTQSTPELVEMAAEDWSDPRCRSNSRIFVERYCAHWWEWRTIFRCRNLASEEGDRRFQDARRASVAPLIEALTTQISRAQAKSLVPNNLSARASAGAILTLLERLAAVGPLSEPQSGIDFDTLKDSAAHMVSALTGSA